MKKLLDNKIFKFIYGTIKFILVACILLYLVFVVLQRMSNNKSILGYRVFTVATGSMEPVYNVNDILVVKDCDVAKLKVGDDIAYIGNRAELDGILVTHRLIKIDKDENGKTIYQTKGVNNDAADPTIKGEQIYGQVIGKLYGINLINHIVKNQYGFFFLVFVPLVLVIFLEVADTIIDIKVEKKKLKKVENKDEEII